MSDPDRVDPDTDLPNEQWTDEAPAPPGSWAGRSAFVFASPLAGAPGERRREGDDGGNAVPRYWDRFGCLTHSRAQIARNPMNATRTDCLARVDPSCTPRCRSATPAVWQRVAVQDAGYFDGGTVWVRTIWLDDFRARVEVYAELLVIPECVAPAVCKAQWMFRSGDGIGVLGCCPWQATQELEVTAGRNVVTAVHEWDDPGDGRGANEVHYTVGFSSLGLYDNSGFGDSVVNANDRRGTPNRP